MSRPQVTITLGNSGQKVVKRPWANSDRFVADGPALSGSKRSLVEDRNADDSLFYNNKRLQRDAIRISSGYSGSGDVMVGGNDLRLKLLRKRMDKRMKLEEQKRIEQGGKMSRTIQSSLRNIPPSRKVESLQMESLRNSIYSQSMDRPRPKSPDKIPKLSGGTSSSRSTDEMLRLRPRPIDASRTGYRMHADPLEFDPYHPKGSESMPVMSSSTRTSLDMCKPAKECPPASSSMLRSTRTEEPLTVTGLLHSLGLGKYSLCFQAEEVDMAALKQMGDRDLKELGIPMGPRKKILLAMLARARRPIA